MCEMSVRQMFAVPGVKDRRSSQKIKHRQRTPKEKFNELLAKKRKVMEEVDKEIDAERKKATGRSASSAVTKDDLQEMRQSMISDVEEIIEDRRVSFADPVDDGDKKPAARTASQMTRRGPKKDNE